ncbi:MAG: metalloregulator ArsR/SmtB family transcription factor [Acidobacteriota bacterium]|nr:metalloregulator ArsR/SmtB family transcription factor [Acidobacteriota bacterium]
MKGLSDSPSRLDGGILNRMAVLGDPLRSRILLLLEHHELTVSEVCAVLQLPQSTVSRHLKVLSSDGWIGARKDGTSRCYSIRALRDDSTAARLWRLVREEQTETSTAHEDARRLESILARRRTRSKQFFTASAARWAELRQELFGERFDLEGLLGLLDEDWIVGDLGSGTGQLARTLAPHVAKVIAVDDSPAMLDAAARRLEGVDNVDLRHGRLEELPIEEGSLDVATLVLVLHHLPEPERVLAEAARALKPGGKLLVVDMLPHEREDYRKEMGHVWLGFSQEDIEGWFKQAGFDRTRVRHLVPDAEAKGPGLFSATATRPKIHRIEFPSSVKPAISRR